MPIYPSRFRFRNSFALVVLGLIVNDLGNIAIAQAISPGEVFSSSFSGSDSQTHLNSQLPNSGNASPCDSRPESCRSGGSR